MKKESRFVGEDRFINKTTKILYMDKNRKKVVTTKSRFRIKYIIAPLVILWAIGYIGYKIGRRILTDNLIKNNSVHIKAVIIDDKNFLGNQNVDPEFSYSYQFKVNGKDYTNNAHNISLKIGDSVEVEFVKDWPFLNRPLHPID